MGQKGLCMLRELVLLDILRLHMTSASTARLQCSTRLESRHPLLSDSQRLEERADQQTLQETREGLQSSFTQKREIGTLSETILQSSSLGTLSCSLISSTLRRGTL